MEEIIKKITIKSLDKLKETNEISKDKYDEILNESNIIGKILYIICKVDFSIIKERIEKYQLFLVKK
jgi:hypothetical protein